MRDSVVLLLTALSALSVLSVLCLCSLFFVSLLSVVVVVVVVVDDDDDCGILFFFFQGCTLSMRGMGMKPMTAPPFMECFARLD